MRPTTDFDKSASAVLENFDPMTVTLGLAAAAVILLLSLVVVVLVQWGGRREEAALRSAQAQALDGEIAELKGRLQTIAEISLTRQTELTHAVNDHLDRVTHRLGLSLTDTSRRTHESLAKLNERLAVIDTAQRNITELSSNMVSLQTILTDKQQRGAFGQIRMESIIRDGLPNDAYSFQPTLSNGKRPDCLIYLPNTPAGIVVDAKFPLEGFEALRVARDEEAVKRAAKLVRLDVGRHIEAIAAKYLLPGETQDSALMFVPSEAFCAELHEHFADLLQKAHRARVVIVSPNMLMLAVQTMQAILKDVKMREQAGLIQNEVLRLVEDVHRLRERVVNLQRHFGLANKDIEQILTSSDKVTSRGRRIETLDFEASAPPVPAKSKPAQSRARRGTRAAPVDPPASAAAMPGE